MAVSPDYIYQCYKQRQGAHQHRIWQGQRVRDVLSNKLDIVFKDLVKPGEEPVVGNLIWAAARTISQRVGRMPRLDVQPLIDTNSDSQRLKAEKHEQRLLDYTNRMNLAGTRRQAAYWLVTHDMAPLVVRPAPEYHIPIIEVRDPLTCFPGTVYPHKPDVVNVLFANQMSVWQARAMYGSDIDRYLPTKATEEVQNVTIGEYFDGDGVTTAMLEPGIGFLDYQSSPVPGQPMVIIPRGFSCDLDFHGQFDNVIAALIAQAKLFGMVMSYAGQQVSAETVVIGEVSSNQGRWAMGPGAVNQIVPMPGASANKLVNNMSPQIFNELDRLERAIRLGGQFPAQLSGEPVASIATGKGLEQLTVTVDDNVAYLQTVLDDAFSRAYGLIPPMARTMGSEGSGDFSEDMVVYVRSLSGADPAETVRMLQLQGAHNLSRLSVMERLPEIDSPIREIQKMDVDDMRMTLTKSIEGQLAQGSLAPDVVARMISERKEGKEIEDIWQDITRIQMEQQQEQQSQMAQTGQPGQAPPGQAPQLDQLLSPGNLVKQAQNQLVRGARTAPQTQLANRANVVPGIQPGAGPPGPPGIPQ